MMNKGVYASIVFLCNLFIVLYLSPSIDAAYCSAGYYSPNDASPCYPCQPGTYSPFAGNTIICAICGAGMYNTMTAATRCLTCSPGTISTFDTATTCVNCAYGKYASGWGMADCSECSRGYWSPNTGNTAASNCSTCAMGYIPNILKSVCSACVPGTFSEIVWDSCTNCNAGTFNDSYGATMCGTCPSGSYTDGVSCKPCTVGKYSVYPASACSICAPGFFSNATGLTACYPCPSSLNTSISNCISCDTGLFMLIHPLTSKTYCSECIPGMYINTTSFTCLRCPIGQYSTGVQEKFCLSCAAGQFSFQDGLTLCIDCPLGTYSPTAVSAPSVSKDCYVKWDGTIGFYVDCKVEYNNMYSSNGWYSISLTGSKVVNSLTFYDEGACLYSPNLRVYVSFGSFDGVTFVPGEDYHECVIDTVTYPLQCPYTLQCNNVVGRNVYLVNVPFYLTRDMVIGTFVNNVSYTEDVVEAELDRLLGSSWYLLVKMRNRTKTFSLGDMIYVDVMMKNNPSYSYMNDVTLNIGMVRSEILQFMYTNYTDPGKWGLDITGNGLMYEYFTTGIISNIPIKNKLLFTMVFRVKALAIVQTQDLLCVTPGWSIVMNSIMKFQGPLYTIGYENTFNLSCIKAYIKYVYPPPSVAPVPSSWTGLIGPVFPFAVYSPMQAFTVVFRSVLTNPYAPLVFFNLVFKLEEKEFFKVKMDTARSSFLNFRKITDGSETIYSFLGTSLIWDSLYLVNRTANTSFWIFDTNVDYRDIMSIDFIVNSNVDTSRLYKVFCVQYMELVTNTNPSYPDAIIQIKSSSMWAQGYLFDAQGCLSISVSSGTVQFPRLKVSVNSDTCPACPVGTYGNGTRQTSCIPCRECTNAQYYSGVCSPTRNSQCLNLTQCQSGYAVWIAGDRGNFTRLGSDNVCCRECSSMEYYNGNCSLTDYGGCFSITQCQMGYGVLVAANRGNFTRAGKDAVCAKCCPNQFWYAGNGSCLALNDFSLCKRCKVCYHGYVQKCSMFQDAICSPKPSYECVAFAGFDVPPWLFSDNTLRCEKGQYIQNFSLGKPVCDGCSGEYIGANGMYCEPCLGYRQAYWDHSLCVCTLPTIQDFNTGDCICPPGYYIGYFDGCQICPINTYKPTSVVLNTDWYNQASSNGCLTCENGKYAPLGQTMCLDCPAFHYRLGDMPECVKCGPGWYAPFKNMSICSRCVSGCQAGYYSDPCPTLDVGTFSNYICRTCTGLPNNSHWVEMDEFSPVYECIWACNQGYYRGINECKPCSSGVSCEPGKQVYPCTDIQDVSCEWDCVNETKPTFHSVWVQGCEWGCKDGYRIQKMDYGMFITYECIWNETQAFWHW